MRWLWFSFALIYGSALAAQDFDIFNETGEENGQTWYLRAWYDSAASGIRIEHNSNFRYTVSSATASMISNRDDWRDAWIGYNESHIGDVYTISIAESGFAADIGQLVYPPRTGPVEPPAEEILTELKLVNDTGSWKTFLLLRAGTVMDGEYTDAEVLDLIEVPPYRTITEFNKLPEDQLNDYEAVEIFEYQMSSIEVTHEGETYSSTGYHGVVHSLDPPLKMTASQVEPFFNSEGTYVDPINKILKQTDPTEGKYIQETMPDGTKYIRVNPEYKGPSSESSRTVDSGDTDLNTIWEGAETETRKQSEQQFKLWQTTQSEANRRNNETLKKLQDIKAAVESGAISQEELDSLDTIRAANLSTKQAVDQMHATLQTHDPSNQIDAINAQTTELATWLQTINETLVPGGEGQSVTGDAAAIVTAIEASDDLEQERFTDRATQSSVNGAMSMNNFRSSAVAGGTINIKTYNEAGAGLSSYNHDLTTDAQMQSAILPVESAPYTIGKPSQSSAGFSSMLTIGSTSIDLNPFNDVLSGPAGWIRTFLLWVIGLAYFLMISKDVQQAFESIMQTTSSTGNTEVMGGAVVVEVASSAPAALANAAICIAAMAVLPVGLYVLAESAGLDFALLVINPLNASGGAAIQAGLGIIDSFFPIYFFAGTMAAYALFRLLLHPAFGAAGFIIKAAVI